MYKHVIYNFTCDKEALAHESTKFLNDMHIILLCAVIHACMRYIHRNLHPSITLFLQQIKKKDLQN